MRSAAVLRQAGDALFLAAHDRQERKVHEQKEGGDRQQQDRLVLDAQHGCQGADGIRPRRQCEERQAEKQEQQSVPHFQALETQAADGHEQQHVADGQKNQRKRHAACISW